MPLDATTALNLSIAFPPVAPRDRGRMPISGALNLGGSASLPGRGHVHAVPSGFRPAWSCRYFATVGVDFRCCFCPPSAPRPGPPAGSPAGGAALGRGKCSPDTRKGAFLGAARVGRSSSFSAPRASHVGWRTARRPGSETMLAIGLRALIAAGLPGPHRAAAAVHLAQAGQGPRRSATRFPPRQLSDASGGPPRSGCARRKTSDGYWGAWNFWSTADLRRPDPARLSRWPAVCWRPTGIRTCAFTLGS